MRINQMLENKGCLISCELFPPKRHVGFENARQVIHETVALRPDFISVTYGAAGGAYKNTVRMAGEIEAQGVAALAHLTCVGATHQKIDEMIAQMREHGIENVLALRGDRVGNCEAGDYPYAVSLVRKLREAGCFSIGAACYPEGHPESENQSADMRYLREKADAGCDFLTTQMFFDNDILYRFMYRLGAMGVHLPVFAGIMPVTNKAQVKRILEISDTVLPPQFSLILDKFGDDPTAMQQAGIAYATGQIVDLIANGVRGIHIYTMNKPAVAAEIMRNISAIVRVMS